MSINYGYIGNGLSLEQYQKAYTIDIAKKINKIPLFKCHYVDHNTNMIKIKTSVGLSIHQLSDLRSVGIDGIKESMIAQQNDFISEIIRGIVKDLKNTECKDISERKYKIHNLVNECNITFQKYLKDVLDLNFESDSFILYIGNYNYKILEKFGNGYNISLDNNNSIGGVIEHIGYYFNTPIYATPYIHGVKDDLFLFLDKSSIDLMIPNDNFINSYMINEHTFTPKICLTYSYNYHINRNKIKAFKFI